MPHVSEMDVSRIDPEEALVDAETVEPGDISMEIDESLLNGDYGKEDKVLVSIRSVSTQNQFHIPAEVALTTSIGYDQLTTPRLGTSHLILTRERSSSSNNIRNLPPRLPKTSILTKS